MSSSIHDTLRRNQKHSSHIPKTCLGFSYEHRFTRTSVLLIAAVNCGEPGQLINGFRSSNNFACQAQITHTCNPNFRLQGVATILCGIDGSWSGPVPICIATSESSRQFTIKAQSSSLLFIRDNPSLCLSQSIHQLVWITTMTDFCQNSDSDDNTEMFLFVFFWHHRKLTQSKNRKWQLLGNTIRVAVVNCGPPPVVSGASQLGTDFTEDGVVTYSCGGCSSGGGSVTCQSNGRWTPQPADCQRECRDQCSLRIHDAVAWRSGGTSGGERCSFVASFKGIPSRAPFLRNVMNDCRTSGFGSRRPCPDPRLLLLQR